jgi:hypothetical protein
MRQCENETMSKWGISFSHSHILTFAHFSIFVAGIKEYRTGNIIFADENGEKNFRYMQHFENRLHLYSRYSVYKCRIRFVEE